MSGTATAVAAGHASASEGHLFISLTSFLRRESRQTRERRCILKYCERVNSESDDGFILSSCQVI